MANKYTPFRFISDTSKECSDCGEIKPHSDFCKDSKNKRNKELAYYCKLCNSKRTKAYHALNKDNLNYKQSKRKSYVKRKHKISLDDYLNKLSLQNFKCAICSVELKANGTLTHLDHNHITGELRDFLCTNCNRGLGHFQDNKILLQNAVEYLTKHNK